MIKPEQGYVHLGLEDLDDKDLKKILTKMATPCRERRPRKCRRLNRVGEILSMLPNKVIYFNLVGNKKIGDAGTDHLHLLPESVKDLDLSDCGLTSKGIKNVCDFMKTNTSITRLIMWGNKIGDKGAEHIADMMSVNKTLRILCIMGSWLSPEAFGHISRGLSRNKSLRKIVLGNDLRVGDEHVRRLCSGLAVNQGLESLDLSGASITNRGLAPMEEALRGNYYLKEVILNQPVDEEDLIKLGPGTYWRDICSWLALNGLGRKMIFTREDEEEAQVSEWYSALVKCQAAKNVNAIYYFLRNKPDLCSTF